MSTSSRASTAGEHDAELVESLRAGDETAFIELIDAHHSMLLRVAMTYVTSRAVAEEVVQETWHGVLKGIDRFEAHSSLRPWIFKIASNAARTRAVRESSRFPGSSPQRADGDRIEPSVDPDRFLPPDDASHPGHWARAPRAWEVPEERLLSTEIQGIILAAIEQLPTAQRLVVMLRDIEGWSAAEACEALELTDGHQRVLLHRARSRVRAALERHLSLVEVTA